MINIHDFQKYFMLEWACKLLHKDEEEWKIIPNFFLKDLGGLNAFKSKIGPEKIKGIESVKSFFWKSVLLIWLGNNTTDDQIRLSDTINNNDQITIYNNVLYIKRAIQNNIIFIKDMIINGEIISFQKYENIVGQHINNLIDYLAIQTAISKIKKNINEEVCHEFLFMSKELKNYNRKKLYQLIKKEETCFCERIWQNKFGHELHSETWINIFNNFKEIKLIEIQWKILHNIFPTNIILNRMGIVKSEKCDFCDEKDYVEHAFFNCYRLESFWVDVSKRIGLKLNMRIKLLDKSVLLGIEQEFQHFSNEEQKFINLIVMIGKLTIIKNKMTKINIGLIFDREISLRKIDI